MPLGSGVSSLRRSHAIFRIILHTLGGIACELVAGSVYGEHRVPISPLARVVLVEEGPLRGKPPQAGTQAARAPGAEAERVRLLVGEHRPKPSLLVQRGRSVRRAEEVAAHSVGRPQP